MTLNKIVILGVLVLGLGAYIYSVELPKEEQERKAQLFLHGLETESIESISIFRGEKTTVLKQVVTSQDSKIDGKATDTKTKDATEVAQESYEWQFTDQPTAILDQTSVNGLAGQLVEFELDAPIPDEDVGDDLKIYGLSEPKVVVEVKLIKTGGEGKQESYRIEFGKQSEYLGKRFIRVTPGNSVYLVPDAIHGMVDKEREGFRDKTPVEFETELVQSVSLDLIGLGEKWSADRVGIDWKLTEPLEESANAEQFEELLRKLRIFSVETFYDDASVLVDKINLEQPDLSVSLKVKDGEPLKLDYWSVSGEDPETLLRIGDHPTIYSATGSKLGDLMIRINKAVDRKLFSIDSTELTKLSFEINGERTQLSTPLEGDWKVNGEEVDRALAGIYVRDLLKQEVDGVLVGEEANPEEFTSLLKISFESKDESKQGKILVGPSEKLSSEQLGDQDGDSEESRKQVIHRIVKPGSKSVFWISEIGYSKLLPKEEALKAVEKQATPTAKPAPSSEKAES